MLLATFAERRPAHEVDLASLELNNAFEALTQIILEIASIETDDGIAIATD